MTFALTDGGVETSLIHTQGIDLPCFAAFPLVDTEEGRAALRRYFRPFLELADRTGRSFVVDTVTWRASPDWGAELGYAPEQLAALNGEAVRFARRLAGGRLAAKVSGTVGPRGDGYVAGDRMTEDQAETYHAWQIGVLAGAGVDRITALTLTYPEEAIGIVRAARAAGARAVVSFTVETDGRLPDGEGLGEAIDRVDERTGWGATFFMVNCAHPSHFTAALERREPWTERIGGLRVNASARSHAELDAADELDEGDPMELAAGHRRLRRSLPRLQLLGGCCGTDHRHVEAIADAWAARPPEARGI